MTKLLRSRQIFYARLSRIDLPGIQGKNDGLALLIHFAHAEAAVGLRKQPEIPATAERKPPARHFQNAHRKLVKTVRDLVRHERRVGDAVVRMKTDRKD